MPLLVFGSDHAPQNPPFGVAEILHLVDAADSAFPYCGITGDRVEAIDHPRAV
jgi:hypothetical protein